MTHLPKKLISIFAALGLAAFLAGCDTEGPMEQAGESADEAVEETGEAAENIGDEAQDRTDS